METVYTSVLIVISISSLLVLPDIGQCTMMRRGEKKRKRRHKRNEKNPNTILLTCIVSSNPATAGKG